MLGEIAAGLSSLKMAKDILKGLNAANTQAAINEVKIGLQGHIFEAQEALAAAQEAQTTALQRMRELEQEIVQLKDWEGEKQRYRLNAVGRGAFAYTLKPGMEDGEPPHWLCTNCYNERKKSILQRIGTKGPYAEFQCSACKNTIQVHYKISPEILTRSSTQSSKPFAGEKCPRCGAPEFRIKTTKADPTFAVLGVRVHEMECSSCSFTDERQVSGT